MWQVLEEPERISVAARIDADDPFNRYGTHSLSIYCVDLSFYAGARLLRVSNRTPAVGNRYFVQRGDELFPMHAPLDAQAYCDSHFGVVLNSATAADYFRFAHFFSDEGPRRPLVEGPQDLRIESASFHPAKRRALGFIGPPEIKIESDALTVTVCTFEENHCQLCRDHYRLTPGLPLELVSREDSGIALPNPFHDRQLKIGRTDVRVALAAIE